MDPLLQNISQGNSATEFTLSGINVSIANSLRRIIISNIPAFVLQTSPHEENKAVIEKNTTRFNNEVLKQRLSCIPIHITDPKFPYETYEVEINKINESSKIEYITTEDFKIKNTLNSEYLSKEEQKKIFPPDSTTKNYIDFARLRPAISDEIPGETLIMKCSISTATGSTDYMFNNVSVCAYGNTLDTSKAELEWSKLEKIHSKEASEDELQKMYTNFMLLDAKKHYIPNSFDFTIESIGVYTNQQLVKIGCDELIKKFNKVIKLVDDDALEINKSENTNDNSYDVILYNEDYTIGKVIEYILYSKFFEDTKNKKISYCGFIKKHPHDNYSTIRIIYENDVNDTFIKNDIKITCLNAIELYEKIKSLFI
jgi:DNA-directed RNA polymerase subunit L